MNHKIKSIQSEIKLCEMYDSVRGICFDKRNEYIYTSVENSKTLYIINLKNNSKYGNFEKFFMDK